jgi:predicted phage terminase large subunit-like protein
MKRVNGIFYIEDVVRLRGSSGKVEAAMKRTASQDGKDVIIDFPQDPGQAGKAQARYLVQQLAGYEVHYSPESGSKEERAKGHSAQAEAGNIKLVEGDWNEEFITEHSLFPNGDFADQVDATSRGFHRLLKVPNLVSPPAPVGMPATRSHRQTLSFTVYNESVKTKVVQVVESASLRQVKERMQQRGETAENE